MCTTACRPAPRAIAVVAALLLVPFLGARSPIDGAARGDEPSYPELHTVTVLGAPEGRTFSLEGVRFGDERGKVRVGGKRARVSSWDDTGTYFVVPNRVGGGVQAVSIVTRDGRQPLAPLPLLLEGRLSPSKGVAVRVGRNSARHRLGKWQPEPDGGLVAFFTTTRKQVRTRMVTKKVKRCRAVVKSRRCHDLPFGIGTSCTTQWGRECHYERITVPRREVTERVWTLTLRLPVDPAELSTPRIFTSDDLAATDDPPLTYSTPNGTVLDVEPDDANWWIVVGRDSSGVICGQFEAHDRRGRLVSGRFVRLR